MRRVLRTAVVLLSAALITGAYSLDAVATVINIDEFEVVRNGTTLFEDSFDRNTTLNGGSGAYLPSGTNFHDGTGASYFVRGSFAESATNNGQAQLNAANGFLIAQPPPSLPLIQKVQGTLLTGTDPAAPQALTSASTFSAIGLFDLAVPSAVSGAAYQIYLTNSTAALQARCVLMGVRQTDTGPMLQLQWCDNVAHQSTIISEIPLTPAELAEPQIELVLSHDNASSDVITGSFAFGSGNTLATFDGTLTALGSTDGSTDLFTPGLNFAQTGFQALDPVPEPSSLPILLIGLFGLAAFRLAKTPTVVRYLT
jgi:hypothetical protein